METSMETNLRDLSIFKLNIKDRYKNRILQALQDYDTAKPISYVYDIVAECRESTLLKMKGFGKKSLKALKKSLRTVTDRKLKK